MSLFLNSIMSLVRSEKIRSLLDNPRMFNFIRGTLDGSQNEIREYMQQILHLTEDDYVLDMCCGTGDYANVVPGRYLGIDINQRFIKFAQGRYINDNRKQFVVCDAESTGLPDKSFKYSFFISALHHFSEPFNLLILKEISRLTQSKIVVVDLVPCQKYFLKHFLTKLDRGDYVRTIEEQRKLINRVLKIDKEEVFICRLAVFAVYICDAG